MSSLKLNRRLS